MSRNIIAAGDGAVAAPPAALSKRARKRLAKAEAFREKKRLKKERKKEARSLLAQHRQAGAPAVRTREADAGAAERFEEEGERSERRRRGTD